jgi:hypothetical protein
MRASSIKVVMVVVVIALLVVLTRIFDKAEASIRHRKPPRP